MEKKVLNFEQTKNKALRILEFRVHSEREMRQKLARAGAQEENIDKVVEFLTEYRFLNDEEFARLYLRELKNAKKFGKRRIKSELLKKGIDRDIIEEVLAEEEWDEEDALEPLVRKKLGGNFERKNIEKAVRYFAYKGYGYDEIKTVIERIQAEEEE